MFGCSAIPKASYLEQVVKLTRVCWVNRPIREVLDLSGCSVFFNQMLYTIIVYNPAIQAIQILGKPCLFYGIRNMNKIVNGISH